MKQLIRCGKMLQKYELHMSLCFVSPFHGFPEDIGAKDDAGIGSLLIKKIVI